MSSIDEKLIQLAETKSDIRQAIISKGVEVDSSLPFDQYPSKIEEISGGGGAGEKTNFTLRVTNAEINVVVE